MTARMKINSAAITRLRTCPRQLQLLTAYAMAIQKAANDDFMATAHPREIAIMKKYSRSKIPYDITARTDLSDRVRVYIQTANLPSRRHEHSTRGSSLLRALNG
jgi:hypothetical protein